MGTIPASNFVNITPGVEGLAGAGLAMIGLDLTNSTRVPIGSVVPLSSPIAVQSYFGPNTTQSNGAGYYFAGFNNSDIKPASMLFAQYPTAAVQAWARGATLGVSLSTLQTFTGGISVVIDGNTWSASGATLASATSFSNAASIIQTDLLATPPTGSGFTASIAASTSAFTGSIHGNILTVTVVASGTIQPGTTVAGTGVTAGSVVTGQLTGATGGVGTYSLSAASTVASSSLTGGFGTMTVTGTPTGVIGVGQVVTGTGVTTNTVIWGLGTGTGAAGTYFTTNSQVVASEAMTGAWATPTVTYDSITGAFVITSGIYGPASTIAAPTGTLSTSLALTAATGVTLSQGSAAVSAPSAYMNNLLQSTVDFATFFTDFDPDFGGGNAVKQAFAIWNSQQNGEFCYVCLDSDPTPAASASASSSLGYLLKNSGTLGTFLLWQVANPYLNWIVSGFGASVNYTETKGRITYAYKGQAGVTPDVTNVTVMNNLVANGYNSYVDVATAATLFQYLWPGSITGDFLWADSFINQIYLNSQLQLALMELLTTVKSIPYDASGYGLIYAAMQDPIDQALNFGSIVAGIPLSAAQIAEINNQAGSNVATTISNIGYYIQILPATAQAQQLRQSPPITLWYSDGQSVQTVLVNSIDVL